MVFRFSPCSLAAFCFSPSALPPFALRFTANPSALLPIPPPSLAVFSFCIANPSAFTRSFPLETHTKFLRRKTFVQYSGLDSSLAPWARYLVAIAQNSIFAQQRFFKIEESRDAAGAADCVLYNFETKIWRACEMRTNSALCRLRNENELTRIIYKKILKILSLI